MLYHAMSNAEGVFESVDNAEENAAAINQEPTFSVENTADIVLEMNAIDSVKAGTFNKLVNVALHIVGDAVFFGVPAHEMLAEHLDAAEENAILQTEPNPERYPAKALKAGKIKTARYLSKTYQNARSTLVNFLENGHSLTDEYGKVKGKSAIEKEKRTDEEDKSPEDKLQALAVTVKALLAKCDYPVESRDLFIREIDGWG